MGGDLPKNLAVTATFSAQLNCRSRIRAELPGFGRLAATRSYDITSLGTRRVIELALPGTVDKALPFVPVKYQDPPGPIAGYAHQHPVTAAPLAAEREGHFDRAIVITGPFPGQRGRVDAQFLRCRLDDILPGEKVDSDYGFFATAQYSQREPSLSANRTSSAPHRPL